MGRIGSLSAAVATTVVTTGLLGGVPVATEVAVCSGGRVLNVVAHHDDDVLFLAPDLLRDLSNPRVCVRTVFLIGSYYTRAGSTTDAQKHQYMESREQGIRDAYQQASGIVGAWAHMPYQQGLVQATAFSLGSRLSTIELRVPDNAASNDAGTMRKGQLWALYANNTPVWPIPGPDAPQQQQLNRDQILGFLKGVIDDYQPAVINTMDPSADNQPDAAGTSAYPDPLGNFHPDHVATARLLLGALNRRGTVLPRITFYRDYQARDGADNLDQTSADSKWSAFQTYSLEDSEICQADVAPCQMRPFAANTYHPFKTRQYYADSAWRSGFLLPVPYGTSEPRMDGRYQIINRGTKLYLDISGSSTADGTVVEAHTGTGHENQVFVLTAAQGGWNIRPAISGKCLDVPGASKAPGKALIEYTCGANTNEPVDVHATVRLNEAFRITGDPASGYHLTLAHSMLALAAPISSGRPVVQATPDGRPDQVWDLVPA